MAKRIRIKARVKKDKKCEYFRDLYDKHGEYMYSYCMGQKLAPSVMCNGDESLCECKDEKEDIKYDKVETISKNSTISEIEELRKKYKHRYCDKCIGCLDGNFHPYPTIKRDEYNSIYIGCLPNCSYRRDSPDGGYCG